MRVSAHVFIRVFDGSGRLAVLGDFEKYKRRQVCELSPIGGFIEVTDEGYKFLTGELGVKPHQFENGRQLRLLLNPNQLPKFEAWLKDGLGLEPNPARRRFREELGDKHAILNKSDTETCGYRVGSFQRYNGPASHIGKGEGIVTEHFLKIYDIQIPALVLTKLIEADRPDTLLKFVTAAEIKNGQVQRCKIDPMCKYLLK